MWCCTWYVLLYESPNSSIYKEKNKVKKVVYSKKMYETELFALQKLSHPNIVSIDKIERNSFTMKYYPRGDILLYIKDGLPEYVVRHYGTQLIDILIYCHSCGISHRDVKPDNLLLSNEWDLILCDFGLSSTKEIEDNYCGTKYYAPPEVTEHIPYNPMLADTWCYGVTLYSMYMAVLPWKGWHGSDKGEDFIKICLQKDRPYLSKIRGHPWLKNYEVSSYMSKIDLP